jgi:hypothetical protein
VMWSMGRNILDYKLLATSRYKRALVYFSHCFTKTGKFLSTIEAYFEQYPSGVDNKELQHFLNKLYPDADRPHRNAVFLGEQHNYQFIGMFLHVHARTVTILIGVGVPIILNNLSPNIVTLITEKIDEIVRTPTCNGRVATLAAEQYVCSSFGPLK